MWVLEYSGIPPIGMFGNTGGKGAPLVVDVVTDKIYYASGGVVREVGGGGGGMAWTSIFSTTIAAPAASVDATKLGGYNELLIIARGLTSSLSGGRFVYASVDNGASFYTATGDYLVVSTAGVESNTNSFAVDGGAPSAGIKTIISQIANYSMTGVVKVALQNSQQVPRLFVASTSPINALRFVSTSGNLTGGTILILAR